MIGYCFMKIFLPCLLAFSLFACVGTSQLSDMPPYSNLIRKKYKLARLMYVRSNICWDIGGDHIITHDGSTPPGHNCFTNDPLEAIPVGATLMITDVLAQQFGTSGTCIQIKVAIDHSHTIENIFLPVCATRARLSWAKTPAYRVGDPIVLREDYVTPIQDKK